MHMGTDRNWTHIWYWYSHESVFIAGLVIVCTHESPWSADNILNRMISCITCSVLVIQETVSAAKDKDPLWRITINISLMLRQWRNWNVKTLLCENSSLWCHICLFLHYRVEHRPSKMVSLHARPCVCVYITITNTNIAVWQSQLPKYPNHEQEYHNRNIQMNKWTLADMSSNAKLCSAMLASWMCPAVVLSIFGGKVVPWMEAYIWLICEVLFDLPMYPTVPTRPLIGSPSTNLRANPRSDILRWPFENSETSIKILNEYSSDKNNSGMVTNKYSPLSSKRIFSGFKSLDERQKWERVRKWERERNRERKKH